MTNKELNSWNQEAEERIIKALECCSSNVLYEKCVDCPYEEDLEKGHTCIIKATKSALDLINRQKAEIERLLKAIKVLEIMADQNTYALKKAKTEAVKEFAERLKKELKICLYGAYISLPLKRMVIEDIDNLLKEYVRGVEKGIDLMFDAVRIYLNKEAEAHPTEKGGAEE